jgi:hypothetical protein
VYYLVLINILPNHSIDTNQLVSDFILPNNTWNITKLNQYLPLDVIDSIKAINLPLEFT